jgi:hypothetical protein
MQVKIVSDPLSSFPVSLHCPFSLQTQVLQLRNVFSASYINLHIIRTVLNRGSPWNFRLMDQQEMDNYEY